MQPYMTVLFTKSHGHNFCNISDIKLLLVEETPDKWWAESLSAWKPSYILLNSYPDQDSSPPGEWLWNIWAATFKAHIIMDNTDINKTDFLFSLHKVYNIQLIKCFEKITINTFYHTNKISDNNMNKNIKRLYLTTLNIYFCSFNCCKNWSGAISRKIIQKSVIGALRFSIQSWT